MKNYIFLFLLFSFINSFADVLPVSRDSLTTIRKDTIYANEHFRIATEFYADANYDSAIIYYKKSSAIFKAEKKWEKFISSYNNIGKSLNKIGKQKEGLEYLYEAIKTGQENLGEINTLLGESYNEIGIINVILAKYEYAEELFDKALSIYTKTLGAKNKEVGDCLHNKGVVYYYLGDYDSALAFYQDALSIRLDVLDSNNTDVAKSYNNIAMVYDDKGNYDKAIEFYNQALLNFINAIGENHWIIATIYNNIGVSFLNRSDFDNALDYLSKSLSIRLNVFGKNHREVANSYLNLGLVYEHKMRFDEALKNYNKSLAINIQVLGEEHPQTGVSYLNVGGIYFYTGEFDKALKYHQKALSIMLKTLKKHNRNVRGAYRNLGDIYLKLEKYDEALSYFNNALKINYESLGEKHPDNAKIFISMSEISRKQGNLSEALMYCQKAINSFVTGVANEDVYTNPELEKISNGKAMLNSIRSKAYTLSILYEKTKKVKDLEFALETYSLAANVVNKIRNSYESEDSKLFLKENTSLMYQEAIHVSMKLYNITKKEKYKEIAFKFSEENKATVFLQSLTESRAKQFGGIPDSLLKKEKELRIDLAFYDTELNKEKHRKPDVQDSAKIRNYEDRFFHLNKKNKNLLSVFEKNYPKYYKMKYENKITSVKSIQQRLGENEVLLEYFIGDSSLFIFTIDKNNLDIHFGTSPGNNTIKKLNYSIYNLDTDKYLESSYSLYSKLIKPIEEKIKGKEVLLIPDGILHYVPFDVLLTKEVKKETNIDYSTLSYLINDYNIKYSYSATMACSDEYQRNPSVNNEGFVGFAPVFSDSTIKADFVRRELAIIDTFNADIYSSMKRSLLNEDDIFNPLPASEEEVKNIYEMFKKNNRPADIYLHSKATEELLKSHEMNKYKYVHLATHAFMNEENPKLSGIVLTTDSKGIEDGVLYSEEIYNLDLNADLVVLSACESGLGEIVKGEGVVGFTRGLIFSGVKNIIVSLWNVVDISTAEFMTDLYSRILEGKKYAVALRETKLSFIKNDLYSEPFYWAAFNLVGY